MKKTKKTDHSVKKVKKSKKSKKKLNYYLIHNNGGISFVVVVAKNNKSLNVYMTLYNEDEIEKEHATLEFVDYSNPTEEDDKIIVSGKPVFSLSKIKKIFVGHDVDPGNTSTYINNKMFGYGNSILVFDGKDYYSIRSSIISKLDTKKIKGKVIGYISPIIGSDVSYPKMLTTTHIYTWIEDIYEHILPPEKKKMNILNVLFKAKSPHDIPKKYYKDIEELEGDYRFPYLGSYSDTILKQKIIFEVT
jgi:hypothetical protein